LPNSSQPSAGLTESGDAGSVECDGAVDPSIDGLGTTETVGAAGLGDDASDGAGALLDAGVPGAAHPATATTIAMRTATERLIARTRRCR
jgi:hypothetical protein